MPTIITRAQAGLPPVPSSVGHRSLSSWTGIKVHHTGGAFSSWRAIYDWQVRNRPASERLVDIGYSFGIYGGRVTELRGWTRSPEHDHQNSTLGVVLGGNYQSSLPSAADLEALVWFCREARLRTGKRLSVTGHRDTWPRGDYRYSTCPGDRLYSYLPTLRARVDGDEEDEMPTADEVADAVLKKLTAYRFPRADGKGDIGLFAAAEWGRKHPADNKATLKQAMPKLDALLASVAGDDVQQVVRAELDAAAARERTERAAERAQLLSSLTTQLGPLLVAELRDAAGDLPAETVEAAVERALARTSLSVAPADDES